MSFSTWREFLEMGGYALYVWGSYGLTVVVLAGVLLAPLLRHHHLRRDIARQERRARRQES